MKGDPSEIFCRWEDFAWVKEKEIQLKEWLLTQIVPSILALSHRYILGIVTEVIDTVERFVQPNPTFYWFSMELENFVILKNCCLERFRDFLLVQDCAQQLEFSENTPQTTFLSKISANLLIWLFLKVRFGRLLLTMLLFYQLCQLQCFQLISLPSCRGSIVCIMSCSNPCRKWVPECKTGMLVWLLPSPATTPDIAAPVTPACDEKT